MSDLPSCDAGSLEPELRLVLLGSIGCGKTLTGDTLLGVPSSPFASGPSPRLCQLRRGTSAGRRLTLVEAPRWFWSGGHMDTDVRKETERALGLCEPGPHAFLLLVPVGQFTEVERRVPSELEVVFGEGVLDHTLVLLTCGDYLMGKEPRHYLEGEDPGLREVIDRCGGRYHVINNRQSQDRNQVRELLEKVENLVQKQRGCYMKQNALQRENEALARDKERVEQARQREKEEQARQREREEQARQREREEQARQREREEQAREEQAREEEARQREKEEQARQREREEQAREEQAREEEAREREREEQARQREREEQARQKEREEQEREEQAREEQAREREREEQARQREREEQARQKERAEQARQKESEEQEREEQAREREKELREVKVQARERVMEDRANERERELRDKKAEVEVEEEKRETVLESRHATVTETRRYWGSRSTVLPKSTLGRTMEETQKDHRMQLDEKEKEKREEMRRKQRDGMEERREETENGKELMEERVTAKPVVKSLYSTSMPRQQPPEPQNGGPPALTRTPSFNLTKEGAILSQLSADAPEPTKKVVNTIYHRINSSEKTPSSPRSPASPPLVYSEASPSSPLFSPAPPSPPPCSSEMRVVMLGRSGSGKSAVGNVLLGREEFVSRPDSTTPITQDCQKGRAIVAGRQVAVVDTPDWFYSDHTPEQVRSQLSSCVALAAPGPHAFLLCVPVDQPARAELKALNVLEKVFGPGAVRTHTLVLFTHVDRLRQSGKASGGGVDEVERYISSQRRDLLEVVERCGDRYHVMEGGAWRGGGGGEEERRSVEGLLEKVERTVREGGGGWYSCTLFQKAEDRVRQRQTEIARERRGRKGTQGLPSPSMQPLTETEEDEVEQEEMEQTREEAERSVGVMELEGLPSFSSPPSFMVSIWDAVGEAGVRALSAFPSLFWANKTGAGAINVENLPPLPSSAQSLSSLPSSAQSPSSLPSSAQSPSFLHSVWEKVGVGASRIPKSTAGGAFLGAVLGAFFAGPVGGAVGATAGSVMTEVGRRRLGTKKNSPEEADLIAGLEGQVDKLLKTK